MVRGQGSALAAGAIRDTHANRNGARYAHRSQTSRGRVDGTLRRGAGKLSTQSGTLDGVPVTWAARTEQPDGRTSPEELIAAAHTSCFAMALALVLEEAGSPPEKLAVSAACTLDTIDGAPQITTSELDIQARVAGLGKAGFQSHVMAAGELCPISKALRGGVKITVRGELEPDVAAV